MPTQDAMQIKAKILSYLRLRGPALPVHIAKETGLSILFASAFLSELVAEKEVKISDMKVGNSPVYFIPSQKNLLDKFSQHLKSKEKDAYILLKEKKFLKDMIQEPAIRVALRSIKDFAIPFEKNSELYWRFHTISPEEFENEIETKFSPEKRIIEETQKPIISESIKEKTLDIFEKKELKKKEEHFHKKPKEKIKPKKRGAKEPKRKASTSTQDKFFNTIKEYINSKNIEILDILSFSKSNLILKVKDSEEKIIIAYNKKKINEKDILDAHKKASEFSLPYIVITLGEPSKKISNLIDAIKSMNSLKSIE